tara:strand:- start:366 stop:572 length:207 start_codon:yes stop_codon:yes gene_type:complete
MKVGDLVTLSAAGRQRQGNTQVRKGIGMVMRIESWGSKYPIVCSWPTKGGDCEHRFKRYELKKVKKSS